MSFKLEKINEYSAQSNATHLDISKSLNKIAEYEKIIEQKNKEIHNLKKKIKKIQKERDQEDDILYALMIKICISNTSMDGISQAIDFFTEKN